MKFRKINNNFPGKVFGNVVLAASILMFSQCSKESTDIVPEAPAISAKALQTIAATAPSSASGYDLTKSLPKGYSKKGDVDYTSYIQKAINANSSIVFPAFPIMVNDNGLLVKSNKTLTFLKGSKIILKASSKENYDIFKIYQASDVKINFPVIVGDRYTHKSKTGEWGHGISVIGSSNVVINTPTITNCWGDGIYIANYKTTVSKNISIVDAYCRYNRRDGMSVISVDGLKVDGGYFGDSDGTKPMCGINMEPNNNLDELKNIVMKDIKTENNPGFGLQVNFKRLYGNGSKKVNIDIVNHTDKKSGASVKSSCYLDYKKGSETVSGNLTFTNPYWGKYLTVPLVTLMFEKNLKLNVVNPTIQTSTGALLSKSLIQLLLVGKGGINKDASYSIK